MDCVEGVGRVWRDRMGVEQCAVERRVVMGVKVVRMCERNAGVWLDVERCGGVLMDVCVKQCGKCVCGI